jgi:uncharacterized protein (TIGR03435 family)
MRFACVAFIAVSLLNAQEFEAASVKPSETGGTPHTNFPLGGDAYVPNGGLLLASNMPLVSYIFFAYDIKANQGNIFVRQLPAWVRSDRFDIQARGSGNPSKSEMRLMMRTLLASRFQLQMHTEMREMPVLAMVLSKAGKLGPQIRPHANDVPCPAASASLEGTTDVVSKTIDGGFPNICGSVSGMPSQLPGRLRSGARDVTMDFIANYLSGEGTFGRPLIDATGMPGRYDFAIEWNPPPPRAPGGGAAESRPDVVGTTLEQAIREQLGLKFVPRRSSIEVLVLDHIEHPSAN